MHERFFGALGGHRAFDLGREGGDTRRYLLPLDRWLSVCCFPCGGLRSGALFDDITDRKRAEAALAMSEARQAFLLELSDALPQLTGPVAVQEVAARLLGEHLDVDRAYYARVDWERGAPLDRPVLTPSRMSFPKQWARQVAAAGR